MNKTDYLNGFASDHLSQNFYHNVHIWYGDCSCVYEGDDHGKRGWHMRYDVENTYGELYGRAQYLGRNSTDALIRLARMAQ